MIAETLTKDYNSVREIFLKDNLVRKEYFRLVKYENIESVREFGFLAFSH